MFSVVVDRVSHLDDSALIDRLRELEVAQRRLEAELAATVAEAERRELHRAVSHRTFRSWLRSHTNWSGAQTTRRVHLARLVARLPAVGQAVWAGHVGVAQADELARAGANPRCGERLGEVVQVLLEHCEHLDFDDARTCIRRWETLADADGAHRDRELSVESRTAHVGALGAGVHVSASGGSVLDAAEMDAVFTAYVDAEFRRDCAARDTARSDHSPAPGVAMSRLPRSAGQRRFDALLAIFRTAGHHRHDHTPAPATPVVNLIGDIATFEDSLADHGLVPPPDPAARPSLVERRCETSTGQVVLPDDLLRAALSGHVRRVAVDTAGVVIDWGRRRRLFTGAARDAARLLVRRCQRPGCDVPAGGADVDHLRAWSLDGTTDQRNAGILCRHDNRAKHRLALTVHRTVDGYLNWRDSDGRLLHPAGRRHVPDDHDVDIAIRRRIDDLVASRQPPDRSDAHHTTGADPP